MFQLDDSRDDATVLRMDDGKVNAMGVPFMTGMRDAWREAVARGAPVVLVGNDRVFSAGLDLRALPRIDRGERPGFFNAFVRMMEDILQAPVPTVAAVDGAAMAGGAVLAFGFDVGVAGPSTRMALTEVAVGLDFPPPEFELCRAALPRHEHGPAFLEAAERRGAELVERGWAHYLADDQEAVLDTALEHARTLGDHDQATFLAVKRRLVQPLLESHAGFDGTAAQEYVLGLEESGAFERVEDALEVVRGRGRE